MGVVVAARHLDLEETVAIKFLLGEPSDRAVARFLREARAAAKVKGEHVCRVFDFGRLESGEPYIVMEYLEGTDLARRLEREGPQPVPRVVGWVVEVCHALAEAHALGIVHRDLKPANVFLATRSDGSSCAKVLDFGISKLQATHSFTDTATMMGSPVYMSPEQMESSRDVDARSDLWSVGVMMYELLTGRPPFAADSILQLAVQVRDVEPPPFELVQPTVPAALARVITKCLAKKPDDRYAGVSDLVGALAPFAPSEVAPLVARLTRARIASSEGVPSDLALDVTAERIPPRPAALGAPAAQGTFSPVESGRERHAPPRRSPLRWPLAVAGAAVLAILAVGADKASKSRAPTTAAHEAAPAAPTSGFAVALGSGTSAVAQAAPARAADDAGTVTAPMPRPSAPSVVPQPARRRAPEPSIAPAPPAPSLPLTPAAEKATPNIRRARELDRDDP